MGLIVTPEADRAGIKAAVPAYAWIQPGSIQVFFSSFKPFIIEKEESSVAYLLVVSMNSSIELSSLSFF